MSKRSRAYRVFRSDVLRAERCGQDLQGCQKNGVIVRAMRTDGTFYELGSVSAEFVCAHPSAAGVAVARIKSARNRKSETKN